MPGRVDSYGGSIRSEFRFTAGDAEVLLRRRLLWFDRDVDGRWLVWVATADTTAAYPDADRPVDIGALIVRNPAVAAFLEQLGELLLQPERFEHEPIVGE